MTPFPTDESEEPPQWGVLEDHRFIMRAPRGRDDPQPVTIRICEVLSSRPQVDQIRVGPDGRLWGDWSGLWKPHNRFSLALALESNVCFLNRDYRPVALQARFVNHLLKHGWAFLPRGLTAPLGLL